MFTTLCCCVAASTLLADLSARADDDALRAMSFNIRFGTTNDGEDAWGVGRKDRVVAIIRDTAPDIVGLQECLAFQAEYIVEQLPEYAFIGRGRNADGGSEMCAIVYLKERFEPLDTEHFWLSDTPEVPGSMGWDAAITRMVTAVRFEDRRTGKKFHCFNTHFDHRGAEARHESAKLLAARVDAAAEELPVVVLGDFNAQGDTSAPWQALTAGVLRDAWNIAGERRGPANTWNGFRTPAPDAARRIDWILVGPGVAVREIATLDQRVDGRYPSDHFPVIAVLALP